MQIAQHLLQGHTLTGLTCCSDASFTALNTHCRFSGALADVNLCGCNLTVPFPSSETPGVASRERVHVIEFVVC